MKKQVFYRTFFYILGLLILAMGLTLNTKAGLGVSPIISVSYSISTIFHTFCQLLFPLDLVYLS